MRKTALYKTPLKGASSLSGMVAYNDFFGYFVPNSSLHRPAVQQTLRGEIFEEETIDYIRKNMGDGDVIHAGTFFGDFLPALDQKTSADQTVWAFEPNPESYKCAEITIKLNQLQNVILTNAALGKKNHSSELIIQSTSGKYLGGGSTMVQSENENRKTVQTEVVTIDDSIPRNRAISIIHLDVERFEQNALEGGLQTIKTWKPILILENMPSEAWVHENLLPLGYEVRLKLNGNSILTTESFS